MDYKDFINEIKLKLEPALGNEHSVLLRKVPQNNMGLKDAIYIMDGNDPTIQVIYLDQLYNQYKNGCNIGEIVNQIVRTYHIHHLSISFDFDDLRNYNSIRTKIAYKLINAESNKELLTVIPHMIVMDLAMVFYIHLEANEKILTSAMITNQHMHFWEVSLNQLREDALRNTPKLYPPVTKHINKILSEDPAFKTMLDSNDSLLPVFSLSNDLGINGASCMLYPDIMKRYADMMETDIIIVPLSLNWVFFLPADAISYDEVRSIMTKSYIPKEMRLSDKIYLYSRENKILSIAPEK